MSIKSVNNASSQALLNGRMYIGRYDQVLEYSTACIVLNSDKNTTLTIYQSVDKTSTYTQTFSTVANTPFIKFFNISAPYIYFTVLNNSGGDMTFFQFEVIYRTINVQNITGGTVGGNVNIFDSEGNEILSTNNNALNVQIQKSRVSSTVWNASNVESDGLSLKCLLNDYNVNHISVFGNSNVECRLVVEFSSDNTNFFSTQYFYDVPSGGGNFGFTIACASSYVRLKRTDNGSTAIITAIIQGC